MCDLGYHTCQCGEEVKCYQPNSECPEFNGFPSQLCEKCEYWQEEIIKDEERKSEWEREQRERDKYEW